MVIVNENLHRKLVSRTETLRKMNEEMENTIEELKQSVIHNRNILNGIKTDYEISEAWLKRLKNLAGDSVYRGAER
jgi:proline dehydrogenase